MSAQDNTSIGDELTFSQQEDGFYKATYTANGSEIAIYINRESNGLISISSTPDESTVRPCKDYTNSNEYKDIFLKATHKNGVKVIVLSSVPVTKAMTVGL